MSCCIHLARELAYLFHFNTSESSFVLNNFFIQDSSFPMILGTNSSVACPDDTIVFTCTGSNSIIVWSLTPPGGEVNTVFRIFTLQSQVGLIAPTGSQGFLFEAVLTNNSTESFTSTLTTVTGVTLLEGTIVMCNTGDQLQVNETLRITVAGKFYYICCNSSIKIF